MEFVSIDVETANADMASICQIGVALFVDGIVADEWTSYVDPKDYFDDINIFIHGIDETVVQGAPTFQEISPQLNLLLNDAVVVCHTHFDRVAIHQAGARSNIDLPNCTWLDSAKVARRAWIEFSARGYGLANICKVLGHEFKHHDALEDAKAAGHILVKAMAQTGLSLEEWLQRVQQPIDPNNSSSGSTIRRAGNSRGPLFGEVVVFTGTLQIPRREAADMAHNIGCQVASGVEEKSLLKS